MWLVGDQLWMGWWSWSDDCKEPGWYVHRTWYTLVCLLLSQGYLKIRCCGDRDV